MIVKKMNRKKENWFNCKKSRNLQNKKSTNNKEINDYEHIIIDSDSVKGKNDCGGFIKVIEAITNRKKKEKNIVHSRSDPIVNWQKSLFSVLIYLFLIK